MSTSSGARPTPRLDSLTGARFVAALGVFLYHASLLLPPAGLFAGVLGFVGRDGAVGVDFFFVLSGFVLAWSWRPDDSVRRFYLRRFARIAPAYWVALVLGLAWVVWLYRDPVAAAVRSLPALVGIQAWFPDPSVHFAADGVEWSVSTELFFYALFPFMMRLTRSRRGIAALSSLAVGLGVVLPTVLAVLPAGPTLAWASEVLPPARLGEFVCGLLLAIWLRRANRMPIRPALAIVLLAVAYVLLPEAPSWFPHRPVFLITIVIVIGSLASRDTAGSRGILARSPAVRLGEWSYCFYLLHQLVAQVMLFVCAAIVPPLLLGPVWIIASLLAAIGLAGLLHRFVEKPMERRLRGAARPSLETMPSRSSGGIRTAVDGAI